MRNIHPSISCQIHPSISAIRPEAPRRGTHAGARTGPLVYNTESAAANQPLALVVEPRNVDFFNAETGEILEFEIDNKTNTLRKKICLDQWIVENRRQLYISQNVCRKILAGAVTPRKGRFRVGICLRTIAKPMQGVQVRKTEKRAYFGNLQVCGSPWICPVCSDKISRVREQEILHAINAHVSRGCFAYMMVLTFPHDRFDDVADLVQKQAKALRILKASRQYKSAMQAIGNLGFIRALEVTWGYSNGWHPHTHDLFFPQLDHELTKKQLEELENIVYRQWKRACNAAGLPAPSRRHGVKISTAMTAAQYIAKFGRERKWNPGKELAKANSKKGCSDPVMHGRFTPFDLLRAIPDRPELADIFRHYAHAFFGKRQIFWSKGLKKYFCIEEMTDQEIAEQQKDESFVVYVISQVVWYRLLKIKDFRVSLLELAENGNEHAIDREINRLLTSN